MLKCECGNETEWIEETTASFSCDADGNREEKMTEERIHLCGECGATVWHDENESED